MKTELYPITIIQDRYTGGYSGGKWIAFNLEYHEIHENAVGSDWDHSEFFDNANKHAAGPYRTDENNIYGRGDSPEAAVIDLEARIAQNEAKPQDPALIEAQKAYKWTVVPIAFDTITVGAYDWFLNPKPEYYI